MTAEAAAPRPGPKYSLTQQIFTGLIAGVLLGLMESFGAAFVDSAYQNIYGFILVIAILVLRPTGLFGERGREA